MLIAPLVQSVCMMMSVLVEGHSYLTQQSLRALLEFSVCVQSDNWVRTSAQSDRLLHELTIKH